MAPERRRPQHEPRTFPASMHDTPTSRSAPAHSSPGRSHSKSVLIFDCYYATLGGNQHYICMLLGQRDRRWRASLVCPGEGRLTEAARRTGGAVHVAWQPRRLDRGRSALANSGIIDKVFSVIAILAYNLRLYRLIRHLRPDVIQCHSPRNALMIGFAAVCARVPMVLFVKGRLVTPLLDRLAIALARKTVFLTYRLMPARHVSLFQRNPTRFPLLRIGVPFDRVDAAERRVANAGPPGMDREPGSFDILYAGWLYAPKGVHVLIEAFAALAATRSHCRLCLAGTTDDPHYEQRLHQLVERFGLAHRIRFLGWRRDVLDIIAAADAFVLPSFNEGVPRSIVEAMALGKPVVATRVGGVPELLGDGAFGLLADPGDVDGLADCLQRIVDDAELRSSLGAAARAEARANYAFATHVGGLWDILDEVSSGRHRSAHASIG